MLVQKRILRICVCETVQKLYQIRVCLANVNLLPDAGVEHLDEGAELFDEGVEHLDEGAVHLDEGAVHQNPYQDLLVAEQ